MNTHTHPASGSHCSNVRTLCSRTPPLALTIRGVRAQLCNSVFYEINYLSAPSSPLVASLLAAVLLLLGESEVEEDVDTDAPEEEQSAAEEEEEEEEEGGERRMALSPLLLLSSQAPPMGAAAAPREMTEFRLKWQCQIYIFNYLCLGVGWVEERTVWSKFNNWRMPLT